LKYPDLGILRSLEGKGEQIRCYDYMPGYRITVVNEMAPTFPHIQSSANGAFRPKRIGAAG
jgi:hypothetical protein